MSMDIKRKKRLLAVYLLLLGMIFSLVIIVIMSIAVRHGADSGVVIPVTVLMLLMLNGTFAFGYYNSVKSLVKANPQDELRKSTDGWWVLIASLLLLVMTICGFILIFFKNMIMLGAMIMIISGVVFIFFFEKRLKKGRRMG